MLSRKQKWRRVKCRRRDVPKKHPTATATATTDMPMSKGKSATDVDDNSEDDCETTPSISTWSSFESVESALEDDANCEAACPASRCPLPESPSPTEPRVKGVTFEPRVQVFLVTHKSELDTRVKQALWWTGRDAAINKRAWLSHLAQPGCGRQSAGPTARPVPPFDDVPVPPLGNHDIPREATDSTTQGLTFASNIPQVQSVGVGILGCRCRACLAEGEDHVYSPTKDRYVLAQRAMAVYYPGSESRGSGLAGGSSGWPAGMGHWRKEEQEMGSRSYSPASQSSNSPLHDDSDVDMFANFADAYYWADRE